ncbi:MAG: hypothetical protein K2V38_28685, partial [Gemmataceae bacterium]|nr:hypothetical protein [Gemmataceae bacterium]
MGRSIALGLLGFALFACAGGVPGTSGAPADPPAADKGDKKGGFDRTGATRKRLLKDFGGSEESEEAVMLGLGWLAQWQQKDGHWAFDGGHSRDHAAASGLSVLAFLGAGQSHKEGRYKASVQAGLDWLVGDVDLGQAGDRGRFRSAGLMYSQGIATLALCEAYGMTQDPALRPAAQAAVEFIQKAQLDNGSWGYQSRTPPGDTSIVGWQIQALHAARLGGLDVDNEVIRKAMTFLDA